MIGIGRGAQMGEERRKGRLGRRRMIGKGRRGEEGIEEEQKEEQKEDRTGGKDGKEEKI